MLELPLVDEARRQLDICNACRYCEGICAVFPALERRNIFDPGDMVYLASLCHDCRACFEACPYAPPHELAVDIPKLMSEVRERTYANYAWPAAISARVDRSLLAGAGLIGAALLLVVAVTVIANGTDGLFAARTGAGSFYAVVPWLAMLLPFMGLSLFAIGVLLLAGIRFWRDTGHSLPVAFRDLRSLGSLAKATGDVAGMRNLAGGGAGCTYPDERPNHWRRIYHSLVLYGFVFAFVSTVLAALYQDVLGILPPYDLLSAPVMFGTIGGIGMVVGCVGLLAQKSSAAPKRIARPMRTMDLVFILSLILVNVSGIALLALRETGAMPLLLATHLGLTAGLFLALPYGKFAHAVYRYLALIRNRLELEQEAQATRTTSRRSAD
jgi:citrate/tricarballylate utilization protein